MQCSTMKTRFASKKGRIAAGSMSIARETMNLWVSNPHATAGDGIRQSERGRHRGGSCAYRIIAECLASARICLWPADFPSPSPARSVHECEALQIFTKNASQWRARPLPDEEIAAFRQAAKERGIAPIVSHASYLINIATANPALRAQSMAALGEEVDRAEALGLLGVVLHPGARLTTPEDDAIELVVSALCTTC